eukprot:COSAG01_NODE_29504_length_636_cov_0.826816_1_plen_30_part_10
MRETTTLVDWSTALQASASPMLVLSAQCAQ